VGKKTSDGQDPFRQLQDPEHYLDDQQRGWLKPSGTVVRGLGAAFFNLVRLLMRWAYHVEVHGLTHLPKQPPFLLTPNHVSLLDPLAIAAVLPDHILEHTYWAGWVGIMFRNRLMGLISRATHVVPIDPLRGPLASLAIGAAVLARGGNLVWFSEGERSWNGRLQPFQLGVGELLRARPVPAVPVRIAGTYEALPRGKRWPHLHPITVTFGDPLNPENLKAQGNTPSRRIAEALHNRVAALKEE
jgi:long-chain acyl-CoA synthetase